MSRNARRVSNTGIYHIMLSGNERRELAFIAFLYSMKADEGRLLYALFDEQPCPGSC